MPQVIRHVQKRLLTDDHMLKSKILSYMNPLEAIEIIKRKLTFDLLQEFGKSCFGHFLNMKALVDQGHLL